MASPLASAKPTVKIELPFALFGDNWYAEEKDSDHFRRWRWGKNNMQLLELNPNLQSLQGNLAFCVTTIYDRDLEVRVNGQLIKTINLPANYDQTPSLPLVDSLRRLIFRQPIPPFPFEPRFPAECTPVALEKLLRRPSISSRGM